MQHNSTKPILIRLFTLLVSGTCGIFTAQLLLEGFNPTSYAVWVVISAIPNLIPFADLGLGTVVLNTFSDKDTKDNEKIISIVTTLSLYISLFFSFLLLCISAIFTYFGGWQKVLGQSYSSQNDFLYLMLIVMAAICAPLSLSNRILIAKGKSTSVLLIATFTPFFTLLFVAINVIQSKYLEFYAFFGPVLGMLIGNLILSKMANLGQYLTPISRTDLQKHFRGIIKLGLHSSMLSSILFLVPQVPKLILSQNGEFELIAIYALLMTFVNPALSILNPYFLYMVPEIRSNPENERLQLIQRAKVRSVLISIVIYLSLIVLVLIFSKSDFYSPSPFQMAVGGLLVIFYASWGLNFYVQSDYTYQNRIIQFLLLFHVVFGVLIKFIDPHWSFLKIFFWYLIPCYAVIIVGYYLLNKRLKRVN